MPCMLFESSLAVSRASTIHENEKIGPCLCPVVEAQQWLHAPEDVTPRQPPFCTLAFVRIPLKLSSSPQPYHIAARSHAGLSFSRDRRRSDQPRDPFSRSNSCPSPLNLYLYSLQCLSSSPLVFLQSLDRSSRPPTCAEISPLVPPFHLPLPLPQPLPQPPQLRERLSMPRRSRTSPSSHLNGGTSPENSASSTR